MQTIVSGSADVQGPPPRFVDRERRPRDSRRTADGSHPSYWNWLLSGEPFVNGNAAANGNGVANGNGAVNGNGNNGNGAAHALHGITPTGLARRLGRP
jgi:hypothetical protein